MSESAETLSTPSSDAELSAKIVGRWLLRGQEDSMVMVEELRFSADGAWSSRIFLTEGDVIARIVFMSGRHNREGTWLISDGKLHRTFPDKKSIRSIFERLVPRLLSMLTLYKYGRVEYEAIVLLTDEELQLQTAYWKHKQERTFDGVRAFLRQTEAS